MLQPCRLSTAGLYSKHKIIHFIYRYIIDYGTSLAEPNTAAQRAPQLTLANPTATGFLLTPFVCRVAGDYR